LRKTDNPVKAKVPMRNQVLTGCGDAGPKGKTGRATMIAGDHIRRNALETISGARLLATILLLRRP
jgi:hypothetical protein